MRLLAVGNLTIDHLIEIGSSPISTESALVTSYRVVPGGRGGNVAYVSARLKARSELISAVGADYPDPWLRRLRQSGVDTGRVFKHLRGTSAAFYYVRFEDGPEVRLFEPATSDLRGPPVGNLDRFDGVFVTPMDASLRVPVNDRALHAHDSVFVSVGDEITAAPVERLKRLLGVASHLLLNERENVLVRKRLALRSTRALLDRFQKLESVVVTKGRRGVASISRREQLHVPAPPSKPRTPVGAGDSFAAGFIASMLVGRSQVESIQLGQTIASLAIENRYVQAFVPRQADIDARFSRAFGYRIGLM